MRRFLVIAALALACASLAQDGKVTYSTSAVSVKKAIADIGQKSGLKMECTAAMEKEIVILRLQDAPVAEVMTQIAAVTSGTWKKEGEIYYLSASNSVRQVEENKRQQKFAASIAKTLKSRLEPKKAKDDKDDDPTVFMPMMGGGGDEWIYRLAQAIGAAQLAEIPDGGRVVYSSNPTRMQRSLPPNSDALIAQYVADYNKVASAMKGVEEPAKEAVDDNMSAFMNLFGNRMKRNAPITGVPAKALLVASRGGMFRGFTLELKLYDANGKILASDNASLTNGMPFDVTEIGKPEAAAPEKPGPEIELSPISRELYATSRAFGSMGGAANLKFSKELMDALKDPVAHDPLSFVHSEALIAIARQRNEQLVANLPDGLLSFFGNLGPKIKLTAESYLEQIKGEDKAKFTESGGWLIVSPDEPVEARIQRTDRAALRKLISTVVSQGYSSLDDLATYALTSGSPMGDGPASGTYLALFAPNALAQGMGGEVNWDLLRLYGMLGPTQRQSLRGGGRLPFAQLSPDQQAQLTKMLFGAQQTLQVETKGGKPQPKQDPLTEMMMTQIQRFGGGSESDYQSEPTEVMANGLPQNGTIVVAFTSEPVAQAQTMSTEMGRMATMSSMELGMFKFFKEDPKMSQIGTAMPTFDDLKMGSRATYNFSIYVSPVVCQKGTLNDDAFPKDAPVYKMSALPADFQKRIDDMAASFKKNPIWGMIGGMGGLGQKGAPSPVSPDQLSEGVGEGAGVGAGVSVGAAAAGVSVVGAAFAA